MTRLVIVGAGFSGSVTAIEFLKRAPSGTRLTIVNRSGKMARGLAYGTNSRHHRLNVPAGNMSALVDKPDSFVEFCQRIDPKVTSGSFVSRDWYGVYLEELLAAAEREAADRVTCSRVMGEVLSLDKVDGELELSLSSGGVVCADHVVLAFGNFAPSDPCGVRGGEFPNAYTSDPWSPTFDAFSGGESSVLLIGTGLTAIDVMLSIRQASPLSRMVMVSRRGLLPQGHREQLPLPAVTTDIANILLNTPPSAVAYLKAVRKEVHRSVAHWREVITALRPVTIELWRRLAFAEQKRFLRHLQVYWDVHRHRVAPATYQEFHQLLQPGKTEVIAGRVLALNESKERGVEVVIHRRGASDTEILNFDRVINCTGPCSNINRVNDVFIALLLDRGMIGADTLGLGINVNSEYAVLDNSGTALEWLSYVGPMLKAQLWEATAVPELRVHARELAIKIARAFEQK